MYTSGLWMLIYHLSQAMIGVKDDNDMHLNGLTIRISIVLKQES